jgi:hypothetical protein
MALREIGWGCVEWIHLGKDRDRWRAVVNAVMNLRVLAPRTYLVTNVIRIVTVTQYSNVQTYVTGEF